MVKNKGARTVHVVFKDIKPLTSLTTDSMTLEITSYNTLRIVNEEKGRRYTLLSYKISTRDIGNNDTHSENSEEFDDYLSSWLRSKPYLVKEIEDRVEEDQDFELWACDTLRRRLIGLNKLPNLDALFDATDDTLETNSSEERKLDELGAEMAFTMADDEELENMRKLFAYESSESSAADDQKEETLSDEDTMERFVMELNDEQPMIDFSWLDYVREPFKPGISNDSAVTNKYFDEFIESYSTVFGGDFYRYFVRKPEGLRKIIQLKRSRELENLSKTFRLSDKVSVEITSKYCGIAFYELVKVFVCHSRVIGYSWLERLSHIIQPRKVYHWLFIIQLHNKSLHCVFIR
jgi:hypothetical protein